MKSRRLCPRHATPLVDVAELFPGSPTRYPLWCQSGRGGHGVSSWDVVDALGRRERVICPAPEPVRVVRVRGRYRPAANHPWRTRFVPERTAR